MATVVSLHAHPDDEALLVGGWLAQRAAAGDRVVLVFATDGDAGLAAGYGAGSLGRVRRQEAVAAAEMLGATRIAWLDHADSGMAGAPTTGPGRLVDVPVEEAARAVVAILDEEDADVLTGYDANGGYGHPDHVQVHRIARTAQRLAARPPLLLEATLDRTWLVRVLRLIRPIARLLPGLTLPGEDIYTPRAGLSMRVDVRRHVDAKRAALAAHASQRSGGIRTVGLLLALPGPLARRLLGTEWFHAVPPSPS
jgi:LmbE family N-acetylglucosaminyl deacetylase